MEIVNIDIFGLIKTINMKDINIQNGHYTYNDYYVPRVSDILHDMIHEDYLMNWANSMGFKRIKHTDVANEALEYGSEVHRRAEILLGDNEEAKEDIMNMNDMNSFIALKNWIFDRKGNLEVVNQEVSLSCPYYGGTYDLLAYIDNKLTLVDFKTSKKVNYKYFLQLAAYDYLLQYNSDTRLDSVMVLQLNKMKPEYDEYTLDFSKYKDLLFHEQNKQTFISLVYAYYNLNQSKMMYNF